MKQITFGVFSGAILILSIFACITLQRRHARETEFSTALHTAMDIAATSLGSCTAYGDSNDALEEQFFRILMESLPDYSTDANFKCQVDIIQSDAVNGLLSVHVTEWFTNIDGKVGTIEDTKTILLEEEPIRPAYTILYTLPTEIATRLQLPEEYQQYILASGEPLRSPTPPDLPGYTFLGWSTTDTTIYSAEDLSTQNCQGDMTLLAVYQRNS